MAINPMSNDMNIVQKLVIPGLDTDMDIIQKLDDEPNDVGGLTAQELKAKFDEAGNVIQRYINNTLLPNISDTVAEEEVRNQNEATRQEQETTRESNETTRQEQESSRVEAEQGRSTAEEGRATAETQRVSAEQERASAETTRVENENSRKSAETARANAETTRIQNEQGRVTAEEQRADNEDVRNRSETVRESQEGSRVTAENQRESAETKRASAENQRADAETARNNAETQRASAEQERKTAESTRVSNETARQQNETDRQENEQQRQANETARQAAEAARDVFENYDAAKAYVPGNKVAYGGSSYLNQKACKGVAPTDTGYWLLIAKKGTDGQGAGDMLASTYDPQGKAQDVFAYADDAVDQHANNETIHVTPDEKETWNGKASGTHASQHGANGTDPVTPDAIGAIAASTKGAAGGVASLGTDGKIPSSQLPEISSVKTYTATIRTTWTEDEDTGAKTQTVTISGVTASQTAKVDHAYTGSGTSEDYATFVEAENQYLTYITNGYAETVAGGIKFTIFGDANTVNIPIIVEVA